jgi:DNA phosphorothioation-associated DGQHR protein 1
VSTFPFRTPALRVDQPIGTFFVAVLPARLLLQVASSDVMSASLKADGPGYILMGTQRVIQDRRLTQIADYIDRIDSTFPNTIILAANYDRNTGLDTEEADTIRADEDAGQDPDAADVFASKAWKIVEKDDGCFELEIPTEEKLAAIIDGQHRLFAFTRADQRTRIDMNLICSIFIDLPKPIQAQVFATINSTQKPVDRSLTFELFGYNVLEEPERFWTPDKLAVFLARRLATQASSPLLGKIAVAPKRDEALLSLTRDQGWKVSTAVVVDGILRLFSTNPKRDSNAMKTARVQDRAVLASGPLDRSPFRDEFVSGNDALIYAAVENYLVACEKIFWANAQDNSFIIRTIGLQALFDILRKIVPEAYLVKDFRVPYFEERLAPAANIDFSEDEFRAPSGSGRTRIRRRIEAAMGI